jgi:hypothetical protein
MSHSRPLLRSDSWIRLVLIGITSAVAIVACAGGPAATPPSLDPAPPEPTVTAPVATLTASTMPETTFDSAAYGYRALVPSSIAGIAPIAAQRPWDGSSRIDSTGPFTDHFFLPDSRLAFVYGAPTDLDLPSYAAEGQRLKAAWHGCPATPDGATDATFSGTAATVHSFDCGGLHLLSLFVIRDGFGLVVNLMSPPGSGSSDRAVFDRLIAGWSWAG